MYVNKGSYKPKSILNSNKFKIVHNNLEVIIMDFFIKHKIMETTEGTTIILYMDPQLTEFARELGETGKIEANKSLEAEAESYIRKIVRPKVNAKIAKIMFGSVLIATFALNLSGQTTTYAAEASNNGYDQQSNRINIIMDGKPLSFSMQPIIINGTTYIPIRDVAEAYGASVWWNGDSKTVGINKDETKIAFKVGAAIASVNGEQMTVPPSIQKDGTVMVPLRFVSTTLGLNVDWNAVTRTVTINAPIKETTYTVTAGDTLWKISQKFGVTISDVKQANNLTSDNVYVGQTLSINAANPNTTQNVTTTSATYKVVPGDTLTAISNKSNVPVSTIKQLNNLSSDTIFAGQVLLLSSETQSAAPVPPNNQTQTNGAPYVSYTTHVLQKGENMWNLSIKYGIPMPELLKANNMTENSPLTIGQRIQVPVHHIPVQKTVSERHGEYLDWWTEAQYIYSINKVAKVTDMQTGKSFMVKRTTGANHADNEPLTAADAAMMKQVWGGSYSWKTRPVIVEVDGRKIAASMSSMPHDVEYIKGENNFNGHFDIHFKNSTRHKDGAVDYDHQAKIKIAAGLASL